MQLVGTHALLAAAKQVSGEQPLMKGNLGALEQRADRDGELLAAIVALNDALAQLPIGMRLGLAATLGREPLGRLAFTMGADRAIRPVERFKVLAGCVFVLKARGVDVFHVPTLAVRPALSSI